MRLPTISQPAATTTDGWEVLLFVCERTTKYSATVVVVVDVVVIFFLFFFFISKITYSKRARLFIITGFCGARPT